MPDINHVVLVGAPRTGSTLLRLILNAHIDIASPGEAGLPALADHLVGVWRTIELGRSGTGPVSELSPRARQEILSAVAAVSQTYCERQNKRIYCDKSLGSVDHLRVFRELYPGTRFVMLYRHVMDTVASGLDASPWGFGAYGYEPFVRLMPHNTVAALVAHWLDHVGKASRWEREHPEVCMRIRYEDLVTHPERVLERLFAFLGVANDAEVLVKTFSGTPKAVGPGDYKVAYTDALRRDSVGTGHRVPIRSIPPAMLNDLNDALRELGYEPLTETWNIEPRGDGHAQDAGAWATELQALMEAATDRGKRISVDRTIAFVVDDAPTQRWVIDGASSSVRRESLSMEVDMVLAGTSQDLVSMLKGAENAGQLLRSGRIRQLSSDLDQTNHELALVLNEIVAGLAD